jgi:hypothetical protein
MKYWLMFFVYSATIRQRFFQALLLGIILAGFLISNFAQQQNLSLERKIEMIDSAEDARIEKYLKKCFPAYEIRIYYEGDSGSLCSMELAFWVADKISDDQWPKLEKFVSDVAHDFNSKGQHIYFDYGMIPGSIDNTYDRMFNRRVTYVSSLEKQTTHSRAIELITSFNKITESYANKLSK